MLELVAALKHDLAKYVAWRSANLDDVAWTGPMTQELVTCLQADILHTRGDEPAWLVWERHTRTLSRPLALHELQIVEHAVSILRAHEQALRDGDVESLAHGRLRIREAQGRIREALQRLHRRLVRG
jgi:hypothetical protein